MEQKKMEQKEGSQHMPGLRKFISPKSAHRFANLTSFLTRSIIIIMFLVATAFAQVQSHRLSEIRVIDTDLNLNIYSLNATTINATDDVCITGGVCLSNAFGTFYNKTAAIYNANFGSYGAAGTRTGYDAGNFICNASFTGTHLCSFTEIVYTVSTKDFASISGWDGEAWMSSGPAKYAPAPIPVDDCVGFTNDTTTGLGTWWRFDTTTGGAGKTGYCSYEFSLACCK